MKKSKWICARALVFTAGMTALLLGASGCAGEETAGTQEEVNTGKEADMPEEVNTEKEADTQEERNPEENQQSTEGKKEKDEAGNPGNAVSAAGEADAPEGKDKTTDGENFSLSDCDEIIGGKVQSVGADSFVLNKTIVEDGNIIVPEKGEEVLVTVQCKDVANYQIWYIKGGGGSIDMKPGSFADIKEGTGLEAGGYYEGDVFIAESIIIEIYE